MNNFQLKTCLLLVGLLLLAPAHAADLSVQHWALDEAEPGISEEPYSRKTCAQIWTEIRQLHAATYSHHPDFWSNPVAQAAGPVGITFTGLAYFGYAVAGAMDAKSNYKQAAVDHRLTSLRTLSAQKNCFVR